MKRKEGGRISIRYIERGRVSIRYIELTRANGSLRELDMPTSHTESNGMKTENRTQ